MTELGNEGVQVENRSCGRAEAHFHVTLGVQFLELGRVIESNLQEGTKCQSGVGGLGVK